MGLLRADKRNISIAYLTLYCPPRPGQSCCRSARTQRDTRFMPSRALASSSSLSSSSLLPSSSTMPSSWMFITQKRTSDVCIQASTQPPLCNEPDRRRRCRRLRNAKMSATRHEDDEGNDENSTSSFHSPPSEELISARIISRTTI